MQVDVRMFTICVSGCFGHGELVNAHRVSKRASKQVVVSLRQLGENRGEIGFLLLSQVQYRGDMSAVRSD